MKKKYTIRIRDPQLRRIRNELRALLQSAESAKLNEILDREWELQQSEGFWEKNHPNYKKLHRKSQELATLGNNLSFAYKSSIIKCPVCQRIDKDMTFNPVLKEWFCMECYESNRKFEIEQGRPDLYP